MDFAAIKLAMDSGGVVHRRNCAICRELISYIMYRDEPAILSCRCRESGLPAIVKQSWDDVERLAVT